MDVDEAQTGRGAPVAEQPRLDVLRPQRLAQQRVLLQVDLADRQVVRGLPVAVHVPQAVGVEVCHHVGGSRSGPDHGQDHLESLHRFERVRLADRHENHLAALHSGRIGQK